MKNFLITLLSCLLMASAPYNRTLPILDGDLDVSGSAILVDRHVILTASHVVRNTEHTFSCGGQLVKARLIRFDFRYDLALLGLEQPCENVDVTPLAAQNEVDGAYVVIQGYPEGQKETSIGTVLRYQRIPSNTISRTYMLIDGTIRSGSSGGPVLNARGELVGMVQGKYCYSSGRGACIGTAIPLNNIKKFFTEFSQ